MNIYICNCPNTFNYGSMMMGENFISYFNKVSNISNKYFIETTDEINLRRMKEATGVKEIYSVKMDALFRKDFTKHDYINGYLGLKNFISDLAQEIDLVVVLGGDDFTEDYGWKGPVANAIKFNLLQRVGLNVIMFGQTMGPYLSFRKYIMKKLLTNITKIYPRDPITYNYLENLGLKNIDITDDLALLPLSKQEPKEKTKEYITYCPSELIYRYAKKGKREDWIAFNLFMIEEILERYSDKKVVLLAHVLKPEHVDDRKMVNELYSLIQEKYEDRVILENRELYPYEVRNYIQQSLFTVSSRMHPIVSSIQCEIPAIALSYSSKYWGIIGKRYGLEEYILDVRHFEYNEMKEKFSMLINKIEENYNIIKANMRENNKIANGTIMKTLTEIAALRK